MKLRVYPGNKGNKGFTLIEAMLTLAVGSIVTLAGLSILALAVKYFTVTTRSLQVDAELLTALQTLKDHMVQAVDVRSSGSGGAPCFTTLNSDQLQPLNGTNSRERHHGRIENCNSENIAPGQGRYLAVFNAELGQVNNRFKGVSIAFIAPGAISAGLSRSGALYITRVGRTFAGGHDYGGAAAVDLRPNSGSVVITDLVAADVDEVRVRSEVGADQGRVIDAGTGMAVSAKITLTRRIFLDSELTKRWYCRPSRSPSSPGNCPRPAGLSATQVARYVDRSRSVSVTFRNNLQLERNIPPPATSPVAMRKRTFGNIYFFRPQTPTF